MSASELSNVYVQAPLPATIAKLPYVPLVALVVYVKVSESASVPDTVPVAVDVDASSVTEPVWSEPALGASFTSETDMVTVSTSDVAESYATRVKV